MTLRVGVTGPLGRLGSALVAAGVEPVPGVVYDPESMKHCQGFHVIINAAGYNDVDGAEEADRNEVIRDTVVDANVRGPGVIRQSFDGFLFQMSTGFVFDGAKGPYDEVAAVNPLGFYALSKLGGEAAANVRERTLIVRSLDFYGSGPRTDFVKRTRERLAAGQRMALPTNYYGNPTYLPHLVEALLWLIQPTWPGANGWYSENVLTGLLNRGILNLCGTTIISRFDWGRAIAEKFGLDASLIEPTTKPWGTAPRPLNAGLLTDKARKLGVPLHSALEGLEALAHAS